MNIILTINGGIGKSVMATAVCRAIKRQYPDSNLIVTTAYPDVFSNNPWVDMTFVHGQEFYFYNKYVEGKDVMIFANEPYLVTEHILRRESVIETWCKMNGVKYSGERPEIYLNEREHIFYQNKYPSNRPIMVLQTNGGGPSDIKYSWARDMPRGVALSIIEQYRPTHDIFHIRREDQIGYDHTIAVHESFKGIASLIMRSQKRVLIDSFCQHAAAGLLKKSTVLWIANSPVVFGYGLHDNILANRENGQPDLRFSQFSKYNIIGAPNEFPYLSENDIFDIDTIMASVQNQ